MAGFSLDTFVVVDMPPEIERHVRDIRRRYESARQFLPVEITVAGSSGVGVFAPDQDAAAALEILSGIASSTGAFPIEFAEVRRFPDSGVFYFGIKDTARLERLHERLVHSALAFKPSPYPFSPHLTIDTFEPVSPELERELLALPVPPRRHFLESLSVYSLKGWDCRLVRTFPFGRASS
jgi:hypothetical protein